MNGNECGTPRHDKCAQQLRPAQAALLPASSTRPRPTTRSSTRSPRRSAAISCSPRCVRRACLNPLEYQDALAEPIPAPEQIRPQSIHLKDEGSGFFVGWIRSQLAERYKETPRVAFEGGLKVRTTLGRQAAEGGRGLDRRLDERRRPFGGDVAIDNKSGEVRAMVGGQDFRKSPSTSPRRVADSPARRSSRSCSPKRSTRASARTRSGSPRSSRSRSARSRARSSRSTTTTTRTRASPRCRTQPPSPTTRSTPSSAGASGRRRSLGSRNRWVIRTPVSSNLAITLGGLKTGVSRSTWPTPTRPSPRAASSPTARSAPPTAGPSGSSRSVTAPATARRSTTAPHAARALPGIAKETTDILTGVVRIGSGRAANIPGKYVWGRRAPPTTTATPGSWARPEPHRRGVGGLPERITSMESEFRGEPVAGGTYPANIWRTFMLKALDLEGLRRDEVCADLAKEGKKCAEDVSRRPRRRASARSVAVAAAARP